MNDELFADLPRYKTRLELWKEKHKPATWHTPFADDEREPWVAIFPETWWGSYGVKEGMSIGEIFAHVGRLIEESNYLGYGQTEEEALQDLAINTNTPWLEEFPKPELIKN